MDYGVSSANLTPAARQVLNELTEEYKDEILLNAVQLAARHTGEIQEISVRDIIEASKRVNRNSQLIRENPSQQRSSTRSTLERVLRIYGWFGIAALLGGIIYFFFATTDIQLEADQEFALSIMLAGLLFALLPYLYNQWRRSRPYSQSEASNGGDPAAAFVVKWQDIELAIREVAASQLGESFAADQSIISLMFGLQRLGILSSEDEVTIKNLLTLRNRILHEGIRPERAEMELAITNADRIRSKLVQWR